MKIFLLLMSCLCLGTTSFAQLDSTTISLSSVNNYLNPTDSILYGEVLRMNLEFDDASDLNTLYVVVYMEPENIVVIEQTLAAEELRVQGYLNENILNWPFLDLENGFSYRVEVNPQNTSGAYTRTCSATAVY